MNDRPAVTAMASPRAAAEFLDQLLGFQQALDVTSFVDDVAVLVCRMAQRVPGVTEARVCLEGRLLPAPPQPIAACEDCRHHDQGRWNLARRPDLATRGCCLGREPGWHSTPLHTHHRLFGFLLVTISQDWSPEAGPRALAAIAGITAKSQQTRDLEQRLAAATTEVNNLRAPWLVPPTAGTSAGRRSFAPHVTDSGAVSLLLRAVEQSPAAIVITAPNGMIEYVNPGFVKASGYTPEEVIGRDPSLLKSGLTPADDYRAMWQTIARGLIWRGEFHNRRKDGSLYWVASSISPVRERSGEIGHYVSVSEDITEIKALQERLRRSEERYRGASEASLDGLFILDAVRDEGGSVEDFRFAEVNAAGCTMLGREREAIVGRLLSVLLPQARRRGFFDRYRQVFLHRKVLDEQFEIADLPDAPLWLHHTVVPLAEGIAITCRNITDLKTYEAALRAARAAAEDANAAKSVFLATMSHELRTPLNAILGFSELIRDQVFGPVGIPRYAEYAADIHTSGQHLLDLITAILDLSKIEAGKLEIELKPVDLTGLLNQCLALFRARAAKQGLVLTIDLAPHLPALIADERALRQILLNLLANAIKFTPAGGRVTVQAAAGEPGWLELSVTDTGIGIPDDQVERVMRPFEQLDNNYTRGAGGTGLGLALVKALVELHNGTVRLSSRLGHGTTVSLRFPLAGQTAIAARPWTQSIGQAGL